MKLNNGVNARGLTTQSKNESNIRTFDSPCGVLPYPHSPIFPARGKYSIFLSSCITCVI